MPPVLYLIDGHALAYRTYFALTSGNQRFTTSSGEPTAGVFGFASVLLRILEQDKPDYLAVAFDTGKTFRNDLFPEYKGTRAKMPDDLRPQIERIRQMVDAFHFPRLEQEGMEADDVLGSVAFKAVEMGLGVKIITGDRDLLQLVNDRIIVNLAGSKLSEAQDFTEREVIAKLGVPPKQVVDYKALVGDKSDNIPGVPGVGEKTAVTLLEKYPTLDAIYEHLGEISGALHDKLEKGKDSAYLSRTLATIRTDVPVRLDLDHAKADHIDVPAVDALFHQLEFRTLMPRVRNLMKKPAGFAAEPQIPGQQLSLFGEPVHQVGEPQKYDLKTVVVNTPETLADLRRKLEASPEIAFDTETTSTNPMQASLVGISLAVEEGTGYYIPVGHTTGEPQLALPDVLAALRPAMTDPGKRMLGHNAKYDMIVLEQSGLRITPPAFDTMIAEFLLNPSGRGLGLKDMADRYLGVMMTHIEELIGKGKNQITMDRVPAAQVASYAAADAEITLRLKNMLAPNLQKQQADKLFAEIEMPLVPVLAMMEQSGVILDVPFFQQMSAELSKRLVEIEQEVYRQVGYSFNLNSTQQLSKVLFETLKLAPPDPRKKTASGHYSTSADVLEELSGKHPAVDLLLEYRELAKLKSTYTDALPLEVNPKTGRVHTSYNQTGSVTGRLASNEPNLQNIPTRTDLGRKVRCGFRAAPGNVLLSVDYSQIELRIVAHMAADEGMLSAFRHGQDIHATTAAAIYDVPLEAVTRDQRRHAKAINFGLIYGMSAFGLSRSTDLTLAEAENFVREYFQEFPGVKAYLDGIRKLAARQGYVETLLGRRRYFPNLQGNANPNLRAREEREAINAPVQGTAADIMKLAMIQLPPVLKQEGLRASMLLQVHDELVLEVPENELAKTAAVVCRVMENAYPLNIPLLAEAKWGKNWGVMEPYSFKSE